MDYYLCINCIRKTCETLSSCENTISRIECDYSLENCKECNELILYKRIFYDLESEEYKITP